MCCIKTDWLTLTRVLKSRVGEILSGKLGVFKYEAAARGSKAKILFA